MGKYRQVLQRQVGDRQWKRDKPLQKGKYIYTNYTNFNLTAGSKGPTEGFFYNRGRGPIRFQVLNPFISYAMMHDSLSSERIKGARNSVARIRWNGDYHRLCALGITDENKLPTASNFTWYG